MNSVDDLDESCLGYAGVVYEHVLGENKFTFVEQCKNPRSVTILMKAANRHTITQMKVNISILAIGTCLGLTVFDQRMLSETVFALLRMLLTTNVLSLVLVHSK